MIHSLLNVHRLAGRARGAWGGGGGETRRRTCPFDRGTPSLGFSFRLNAHFYPSGNDTVHGYRGRGPCPLPLLHLRPFCLAGKRGEQRQEFSSRPRSLLPRSPTCPAFSFYFILHLLSLGDERRRLLPGKELCPRPCPCGIRFLSPPLGKGDGASN